MSPQGRQDVEADQIVVPLAGGVLKLDYLEPLRDGLPNCDCCLRVPVFVDLALEPGQRALGCFWAGSGLHQVPALAGQGIDMWSMRDRYVDVVSEFTSADAWAVAQLRTVTRSRPAAAPRLVSSETSDMLLAMMRAQASRLRMFASDGWYWEDPSRSETAQVLRFAAHAARLTDEVAGTRLERTLVDDLAAIPSGSRWPAGTELYAAALSGAARAPSVAPT